MSFLASVPLFMFFMSKHVYHLHIATIEIIILNLANRMTHEIDVQDGGGGGGWEGSWMSMCKMSYFISNFVFLLASCLQ